jgi:hypothetical protein
MDTIFSLPIPNPSEMSVRAEKDGYMLWKDDYLIAENETVTMLVEMEKEG